VVTVVVLVTGADKWDLISLGEVGCQFMGNVFDLILVEETSVVVVTSVSLPVPMDVFSGIGMMHKRFLLAARELIPGFDKMQYHIAIVARHMDVLIAWKFVFYSINSRRIICSNTNVNRTVSDKRVLIRG
jgi:hypothetical protein